jgi:hypothetical protein
MRAIALIVLLALAALVYAEEKYYMIGYFPDSLAYVSPHVTSQFRSAMQFTSREVRARFQQQNTTVMVRLVASGVPMDLVNMVLNITAAIPGFAGIVTGGDENCATSMQHVVASMGVPNIVLGSCMPFPGAPNLFSTAFSESAQALATVALLLHFGWSSVVEVVEVQSAVAALEFERAAASVMVGALQVDVATKIVFNTGSAEPLVAQFRRQLGPLAAPGHGPTIFVLFAPMSTMQSALLAIGDANVTGPKYLWVVGGPASRAHCAAGAGRPAGQHAAGQPRALACVWDPAGNCRSGSLCLKS